ncbi:MAG TPA: hypothetical protein VHO28_06360 [Ignavibacteriales bacterium]|nr:hypothetical protein [Ignavibacteriales bacterium]
MKKTLIILLVVMSFAANIYAQDAVKPATSAGTAGLLFTFSGLDNLGAGDFEGGFGGKYFFTRNLALRGIVNFTTASQTQPVEGSADMEASATVFGVGAALEYHFGYKRVSPYLGGGVGFATTSTEFTAENYTMKNDMGGQNVNGATYYGGTSIEAFGLVGVEFFLFDELSLAAEYRLGFGTNSRSDEEETIGNTTTTTKGGSGSQFALHSQGFLTLAIYF